MSIRPHPERPAKAIRAASTVVATSATVLAIPEGAYKIRIKNPIGGYAVWISESKSNVAIDGNSSFPVYPGDTTDPIYLNERGVLEIYGLSETASQEIFILGEVDE